MRKFSLFFVLLSNTILASAAEPGLCPRSGTYLQDKLWEARSARLGEKFDAADAAAKPSAWKTNFWDRVSIDAGYGSGAEITPEEGAQSYKFKQGGGEFTWGIKYSVPLGAFAGSGDAAARGKSDLRRLELDEQRAAFYDLMYDLRVTLAEVETARKDGAKEKEMSLKAEKLAVKLSNMTGIEFAKECIQ